MGDLANRAESAEGLVAKMKERFGRIDVLVNSLDQLAVLLSSANGRPRPAAVAELCRRNDIEQLTALRSRAN